MILNYTVLLGRYCKIMPHGVMLCSSA